jgi:hypothetical protein
MSQSAAQSLFAGLRRLQVTLLLADTGHSSTAVSVYVGDVLETTCGADGVVQKLLIQYRMPQGTDAIQPQPLGPKVGRLPLARVHQFNTPLLGQQRRWMWLGGGIVVVDDDEWHTWTCGTLQGTDQITCVPNALAHPVNDETRTFQLHWRAFRRRDAEEWANCRHGDSLRNQKTSFFDL